MRLRAALFALLFVLSASHAGTESKTLHDLACPNAGVLGAGLITNVCWSCMFPIRLAGIDMFGNRAPSDANSNPVCACGGDLSEGRLPTIGFSLGLWQPTRLIELVRRPYCFPGLGGVQISGSLSTLGGGRTVGGQRAVTAESTLDRLGFWNFHYYSFPLLALLEIMN
ncbi:MAG: conjugal transfer protein TraU, partial [Gammaproteobacteria bacterium]